MKCLRCDNEFEPKSKIHKFCSMTCRLRYNAKKDWLKKKDDTNYRNMKKANSKQWYLRNKKRHNARMKLYMREYYRTHYSKEARNGNQEK